MALDPTGADRRSTPQVFLPRDFNPIHHGAMLASFSSLHLTDLRAALRQQILEDAIAICREAAGFSGSSNGAALTALLSTPWSKTNRS